MKGEVKAIYLVLSQSGFKQWSAQLVHEVYRGLWALTCRAYDAAEGAKLADQVLVPACFTVRARAASR